MNYDHMRESASNGDVMLVEGRGWVSRAIRAFTGQNISHVALLVWIDGGLVVCEMKEGIGFRMMSASQWVAETKGYIYYGRAPLVVIRNPFAARMAATNLRGQKYGYLSLVSVWWAQFTRKRHNTRQLVCSTAVQKVWEACGYKFDQTADPGDYIRLCDYVSRVEI